MGGEDATDLNQIFFDYVLAGTRQAGSLAQAGVVVVGDDHDPRCGVGRDDLPRCVDAVHFGQVNVHQDPIGTMLHVSRERAGAVVAFEDALDQISHQGFHHRRICWLSSTIRMFILVGTLMFAEVCKDNMGLQDWAENPCDYVIGLRRTT